MCGSDKVSEKVQTIKSSLNACNFINLPNEELEEKIFLPNLPFCSKAFSEVFIIFLSRDLCLKALNLLLLCLGEDVYPQCHGN